MAQEEPSGGYPGSVPGLAAQADAPLEGPPRPSVSSLASGEISAFPQARITIAGKIEPRGIVVSYFQK